MTSSHVMLAEAIHSLADLANQVLSKMMCSIASFKLRIRSVDGAHPHSGRAGSLCVLSAVSDFAITGPGNRD